MTGILGIGSTSRRTDRVNPTVAASESGLTKQFMDRQKVPPLPNPLPEEDRREPSESPQNRNGTTNSVGTHHLNIYG